MILFRIYIIKCFVFFPNRVLMGSQGIERTSKKKPKNQDFGLEKPQPSLMHQTLCSNSIFSFNLRALPEVSEWSWTPPHLKGGETNMLRFRIISTFSDLLQGHRVFWTILFQVLSTFDFDFTFACIYHFIGFWTQQNVLKTYWKILPSEKSKQNVQFFYFSFWSMIFSAGMCCLLKPIANFAFFV